MAFNKAKLQSDFEDVFESMTDGNEDAFPNGISAAAVAFVSGGVVSTIKAILLVLLAQAQYLDGLKNAKYNLSHGRKGL